MKLNNTLSAIINFFSSLIHGEHDQKTNNKESLPEKFYKVRTNTKAKDNCEIDNWTNLIKSTEARVISVESWLSSQYDLIIIKATSNEIVNKIEKFSFVLSVSEGITGDFA